MAAKSKTAFATLVLGIASFATWVVAVVISYIQPAPPGHASPAMGEAGMAFIILMLASGIFDLPVMVRAFLSILFVSTFGQ